MATRSNRFGCDAFMEGTTDLFKKLFELIPKPPKRCRDASLLLVVRAEDFRLADFVQRRAQRRDARMRLYTVQTLLFTNSNSF